MNSTKNSKSSSDNENRNMKVLQFQGVWVSIVFMASLWYFTATTMGSELILPTPMAVLARMGEILQGETFWKVIGGSMRHVVLGFLVALGAGIFTGILSGLWTQVQWFFYPWVQFLRATPVMSFILYLILFVPTPYIAIWVAFFIVFPIIHTNVLEGFKSVDPKLLEMADLYKVPMVQKLRRIYWPSLVPYLMAACVTGMGINIKAVITAEALALPEFSIGTEMFAARNYLETDLILAWTIVIILIAVLMDVLLIGIRNGMTKRRKRHVVQRREA